MSTIHHDTGAHRFTTEVDGSHAELDYTLADGVMTITHTQVPPAIGGRGIAALLMEAALSAASAAGWSVNRIWKSTRRGRRMRKGPTSSISTNYWTKRWTSPFPPATRRRWAERTSRGAWLRAPSADRANRRQRVTDKAPSRAATSGPSLGGSASNDGVTPCSRSAREHTGPMDATTKRFSWFARSEARPAFSATA